MFSNSLIQEWIIFVFLCLHLNKNNSWVLPDKGEGTGREVKVKIKFWNFSFSYHDSKNGVKRIINGLTEQ